MTAQGQYEPHEGAWMVWVDEESYPTTSTAVFVSELAALRYALNHDAGSLVKVTFVPYGSTIRDAIAASQR